MFDFDSGGDDFVHVVTQADVNAGYIRSCIFYTDSQNTNEGFDSADTVSGAITGPVESIGPA